MSTTLGTNLDLGGGSITNGSIAATSPHTGVTDGSNATAGKVGEVIRSFVASQTNYPASGQWFDTTSISLTAGDWLVTGQITVINAGSVTSTSNAIGIGTVSGNSSSGLAGSDNEMEYPGYVSGAGATFFSMHIVNYRVNITSTTTYYLKALSSFSGGTNKYNGARITAVRIR